MKMAAFQDWINEVYNPEWDKKDFDDPGFDPPDNVFSDEFEMPEHPEKVPYKLVEGEFESLDTVLKLRKPENDGNQTQYEKAMEEYEQAKEDAKGVREYINFYGKQTKYKPAGDNDGWIEDFRGHLIIACGDYEDDLNTAEKITTRMQEEFGEKIYTETRIMNRVQPDDNVFEVWLESYEIDLLHSRRRNYLGTHGWTGPPNVDDAQLEYLVEEVGKLTNDEAQFSYRAEESKIVE
jgi:hypothetical protein